MLVGSASMRANMLIGSASMRASMLIGSASMRASMRLGEISFMFFTRFGRPRGNYLYVFAQRLRYGTSLVGGCFVGETSCSAAVALWHWISFLWISARELELIVFN